MQFVDVTCVGKGYCRGIHFDIIRLMMIIIIIIMEMMIINIMTNMVMKKMEWMGSSVLHLMVIRLKRLTYRFSMISVYYCNKTVDNISIKRTEIEDLNLDEEEEGKGEGSSSSTPSLTATTTTTTTAAVAAVAAEKVGASEGEQASTETTNVAISSS